LLRPWLPNFGMVHAEFGLGSGNNIDDNVLHTRIVIASSFEGMNPSHAFEVTLLSTL